MQADIVLVEEVKAGNHKAFAELVGRHQRSLLRLALRFCKDLDAAEDVVQESFVKAFQKIELFEGRSSFKSWVYRIAINTAKNRLRSEKSDHLQMDQVQIPVAAEAESALLHEAVKKRIQEEVELLPEKQKTALILRIFEDLSFKEIAHIMDCPYDTAKANYRHALMKLRESMQSESSLKAWLQHLEVDNLEVQVHQQLE